MILKIELMREVGIPNCKECRDSGLILERCNLQEVILSNEPYRLENCNCERGQKLWRRYLQLQKKRK
jgi:predicted nucleic acid binding AN1-type Zn finger protein